MDLPRQINGLVRNGFSNQTELLFPLRIELPRNHFMTLYMKQMASSNFLKIYNDSGFNAGSLISGLFELDPKENINRLPDYFLVNRVIGEKLRMLDFSHPKGCKKFQEYVRDLCSNHKVKSLFLGRFKYIRSNNFKLHSSRKYPNQYWIKYAECTANLSQFYNLTLKAAFSFKMQHLPVYIAVEVGDRILQSSLVNALSLSLAGYSFVDAFIGSMHSFEIYQRGLQTFALFPHLTFRRSPWMSNNTQVGNITRKFVYLHREYLPLIKQLAQERMEKGRPIIRPLWYVEPDDASTYPISDQYMLGDNVLVAPVLAGEQRERMVYFPEGKWRDQHGRLYNGKNFEKVFVPIHELPIFRRELE